MPGVYILPNPPHPWGQPDDKKGQHQEMEEEKNYKGEKWKKK